MTDQVKTLESMSQAIWYNQWSLNKFSKYIFGNILEVGCGIGNFTNSLCKFGKVWAIDVDKNFITRAKTRVGSKANVGFGDIEKGKYFFKGKTFDSIICLNVLEHIQNDGRAVDNLLKLLSSNGNLILLVPAHKSLMGEIDRSIGHYRRYDKNKLKDLLKERGFDIKMIKRLNLLGGLGWFIAGKILKNSSINEGKIRLFNTISPFFLRLEGIFEPPFGTSILVVAGKD